MPNRYGILTYDHRSDDSSFTTTLRYCYTELTRQRAAPTVACRCGFWIWRLPRAPCCAATIRAFSYTPQEKARTDRIRPDFYQPTQNRTLFGVEAWLTALTEY